MAERPSLDVSGSGQADLFAYRPDEASTEWRSTLESPLVVEDASRLADERGRFWVPALYALAAYETGAESVGAFLDRRDEYCYVTVDELIETVATLVIHPWPIVHANGLIFRLDQDPDQVDAPVKELQELVNAHRRALAGDGVLAPDLVERRITIGDTFAMAVRAGDDSVPVSAGADRALIHVADRDAAGLVRLQISEVFIEDNATRSRFLAELAGLEGGVPIVDVSWDAREQGKLAYWAAMAQPLEEAEDTDAEQVALAEDQQLAELTGTATSGDES